MLTNLAPSAIALAVYFCILDVILLSQCLYYNTIRARRPPLEECTDTTGATSEDSPLLASRRSSSSASSRQSAGRKASPTRPSRKTISDDQGTLDKNSSWSYNLVSLLAVYVIGIAGWFISYMAGAWDRATPSAPESPDGQQPPSAMAGLVLGYASAAFYLW